MTINVVYGQSNQSELSPEKIVIANAATLDSLRVNLTGNELEELLIGRWNFVGPEVCSLPIISVLDVEIEKTEDDVWFKREVEFKHDIVFSEDGRYYFVIDSVASLLRPSARTSGKWNYDEGSFTVKLIYHEPWYANEMIKQLNLPPTNEEEFMIYQLDEENLLVMSPYQMNNYENWFYLVRYRKDTTPHFGR